MFSSPEYVSPLNKEWVALTRTVNPCRADLEKIEQVINNQDHDIINHFCFCFILESFVSCVPTQRRNSFILVIHLNTITSFYYDFTKKEKHVFHIFSVGQRREITAQIQHVTVPLLGVCLDKLQIRNKPISLRHGGVFSGFSLVDNKLFGAQRLPTRLSLLALQSAAHW